MGEPTPLVSVVMAVYNGQAYLREAIDSILGQTFRDFEFVIVNDGSTDETEAVVRSYTDHRIRLATQPNCGFAPSLNRGIGLARGAYIARMDADDISAPERFEAQVRVLKTSPKICAVGTSIVRIDESGKPLRTDYYLARDMELRQQVTLSCPFAHGSVMMRKQAVQEVGGYRPEYRPAEDYDLWRRLALVGNFANITRPLYLYRVNDAGMTALNQSRMLNEAIRISQEVLNDKRYRGDIPLKRCLETYAAETKEVRAAATTQILDNYFRVSMACARRRDIVTATYRFAKLALSGQAGFDFAVRKFAATLRIGKRRVSQRTVDV
jgi:glycosyltransferase involved in cell wall biosynthesis